MEIALLMQFQGCDFTTGSRCVRELIQRMETFDQEKALLRSREVTFFWCETDLLWEIYQRSYL